MASLPGPGSATGNQRPWPQDTEPVFLPLRGKPQPGRADRRGCCVQVQTWEGPSPEEALAREGCSLRPEKETFLLGPAPCRLTQPLDHIHGWPARFEPQLCFKQTAGVQVDSCQPLIIFSLTNQSLTWFSMYLKTRYLMDGVDSLTLNSQPCVRVG